MKIRLIAATTLALSATIAHAEPVTINPPPKIECVQPDMLGLQPSNTQIKAYNKGISTYKQCMQTYIKDRQDAAARISELHKVEIEAGNVAIKAFNEWVAKMKAEEDKNN
ncbi:hypothetical protein OPU71_18960 [Niveibacterium sp. 24ML]|uniref:hypothetical protein n=1 Tax=Niveibacterium sp. 24ML TaxID=2985512 RepID=UPI002270BDEB|nr:hypothetical protein [Niveibacterium sp. 24ML]MCX9158209.1 hypothetical protein [Niveibacterium sp. 24ML]